MKFSPPADKTAGGIIIPKISQRIEKYIGELYHIGAPSDQQEKAFVEDPAVRKGAKVIANPKYGTPVPGFCDEKDEESERYYVFRMFELAGGVE